jgi:serine/threonine protein kinase
MSLERWRKIETIFLAALDRDPQERAAFLRDACGDDSALLVQVEGMLAADGQANLIDSPAAEVAADLLVAVNGSLEPGQTVNQYEVIRELGRGGMGQVYLAQDSRLDRPVALKLLPYTFSKDPERVRRFQQEARVVSALNHPCIITIHEIGETDGLRFIVTEFVDGETLREIIARERDLDRTLKIITQVAEALAAVHSVGIVHRDIKPENIMVRSDGYVKVLDFGLAKPTEDGFGKIESGASESSNFTTSPGLILGTVKYMSPEQARGYDVDARTDIFSLGVVLYESVTGAVPFTGKSKADVLISIAREEPKPIAEFLPDNPAQLQQIVDKSLKKEATDRYQTVAEMRRDLDELRQALAQHSSAQPSKSSSTHVKAHPTSVSSLSGERARKRIKLAFVFAATLLLITAAGIGLYKLFWARSQLVILSPANLQFTKLTAQGISDLGSISPDGKYLAYVSDRGKSEALLLRQTANENTVQLVPPRPDFANWGCEFTPDGTYLFCLYVERANLNNSFFERIPLIPGRTERMIDHVDSLPGFSPDGKQVAYVQVDANYERHLLIADLDGRNPRELTHQDQHHFPFRSVAWSADGKLVAAIDLIKDAGCDPCYQVIGVRIDDRKEVLLTANRWENIRKIVWLPDNTGFLMSARDRSGSNEGLWLISYPGGQAQRLTNELSVFEGLSITADGKRILTSQAARPMAIWVTPVAEPTRAQKLTPIDGQYSWTTWTHDGRIVYVLGPDLWIMKADGSERRQLTFSLGGATHPDVSPDDRFVVFSSPRTGKFNVWRLELASGDLKQLTNGSIEQWPLYSPDGKWIVYRSFAEAKAVFWKMPVDGGSATPIGESNLDTAMLAISPDNRLLTYQYRDLKSGKYMTAIRSFEGGPVEKTWDNMSGGYSRQFSQDGKGLIYSDSNNLWMQPLDGNQAKRLTNFTSEHMVWFSLSRDGQNLAFARGNWIWDIVLINVR